MQGFVSCFLLCYKTKRKYVTAFSNNVKVNLKPHAKKPWLHNILSLDRFKFETANIHEEKQKGFEPTL